MATPDGGGTVQLEWVYGNHLGVPLVTTDAAGCPAVTPGDYLAPGFPGQSRVIADLYYNRYRDYDPATGRYIQADPIGLAGGSNPYAYVGGNPVNSVDPSGQCIEDLCIVESALLWGVIEVGLQALDNWSEGRDVLNLYCYDWGEVATSAALGGFGSAWIKGGVRLTSGSMKWYNVSRRIRLAERLVGTPVDLHHWLVPRKLYEKIRSPRLRDLGERLFNRPWNLNVVERSFHRQVIHPAAPIERLFLEAPKAAVGAIGAGVTRAGEEIYDAINGD